MYIHKQKRHVHAYAHIYILKKKTICLQIYKNTCTYENTCKQTHAHTYITYLTNHIMTCHSIPHHAVSYCSMPFHTVPYRSIPLHSNTYSYTATYQYKPLHTIVHYTPLHADACRYLTLHCNAVRYTTPLHCMSDITLHYATSHYNTITLHYITLHCVTLHCITLLCINYITLNYNTIHCIMTLQYAKLHYICACTKPPRIKLPSHSRCLSTHWYLAKVSGHFIYLSTSTQQHVCEITHSNSNTRLACMHTDIDRHRQT